MKTRYPIWVKPNQKILGDVKYVQKDNDWGKLYFNGFSWITEKQASDDLIKKSQLRQMQLEHNQVIRKS